MSLLLYISIVREICKGQKWDVNYECPPLCTDYCKSLTDGSGMDDSNLPC